MIWLAFAVLTLGTVAALAWPVARGQQSTHTYGDADQAVYRGQLDEVDRDLQDGLISEAEAETARTEIKRRLLSANRRADNTSMRDTPMLRMATVVSIAVVVPFSTLAVYMAIGSPGQQATPIEQRRADALEHPDQADLGMLIEQLSERLREDPDSTEGWILLARSYRQMDRVGEAVSAYRRALATGVQDPIVYAEFGDALIAANGGSVPPEAIEVFQAVLRADREEPRARFYLGLARAQMGDTNGAIAIWRDLTASAPADAPWLGMVRDQMGQVAMSANIMPMSVTPRHPLDTATAGSDSAGPAQNMAAATAPQADEDDFRPDVSALEGRFSGDEMSMIQEMVGGLEARLEFGEEDYDGWVQLGRSYGVLGNTEKSAEAYRRAVEIRPDAILPRVQLADLLLREAGESSVPMEVVDLSKEILAVDADNPDGLFIAGLAAASMGDFGTARERWMKLMNILPPGDSARDAVSQRLNELPG